MRQVLRRPLAGEKGRRDARRGGRGEPPRGAHHGHAALGGRGRLVRLVRSREGGRPGFGWWYRDGDLSRLSFVMPWSHKGTRQNTPRTPSPPMTNDKR